MQQDQPGDEFYRRGLDYVRKRQVSLGIDAFSRAIEKGTSFPDAYLQRARLGRNEESDAAINRVIEDYSRYLKVQKDRAVAEEFASYLEKQDMEPLAREVLRKFR